MVMKHHNYTRELLEPIVQSSTSIKQVLQKLDRQMTGGNYCHIKKTIDKFHIDRSHFKGQAWNKGKHTSKYTKESFVKIILVKNGPGWTSHKIKLSLYKFGLKEEKCEKCGQEPVWNNEKLGMHLDHLNGDHSDNRFENLIILCPNCHTQTPTYSAKKR